MVPRLRKFLFVSPDNSIVTARKTVQGIYFLETETHKEQYISFSGELCQLLEPVATLYSGPNNSLNPGGKYILVPDGYQKEKNTASQTEQDKKPPSTTADSPVAVDIPKSNATPARGQAPSAGKTPVKPVEQNNTAIEKAFFPMKYLRITQGVNGNYSHQGTNALDLAGADSGCDSVFAPFTGIVRRIYTHSGNFVWLESVEKVAFADGAIDYMTIMVGHCDDVSNLYVGQIIPRGAPFYREGKAGIATGNHLHLECGRGRFSGVGWHQNPQGNWMINNSVPPYKALFLSKDSVIIYDGGYRWQIEQ